MRNRASKRTRNNRFYPGVENAAQTWIDQAAKGRRGPFVITSAEELARCLFNQWMNSDGHPRPVMADNLETIGLGVEITDDGEVYAALEMCGA